MKFFFFILLLLSNVYLYGQVGVAGKIVIGRTKEPVQYASVTIKDSSLKVITRVITNEKGKFELGGVPAGTHMLEIQFVGYKPFSKAVVVGNTKMDLGIIALEENVIMLNELVVSSEPPRVTMKLDKKVYTVGKDIFAQSGSASEILENIPSVSVDAKGVVSLRGNSNVNVLIDGKRSGLTLNNALDQIPADNIASVEVITSPSARYDSEGAVGIINIILKKNKKSGFNGQVRLVGGIPNDNRVNASLNYKTDKLNLFSTLGYRYSDYVGLYSSGQVTTDAGVATSLSMLQNEKRHDDGKLLYVGADYFIDSKNTITAAFFRNDTKDRDGDVLHYNYGHSGSLKDSALVRDGSSQEVRNYSQVEFNYTRTFDQKRKKFSVDMQYDFWNSDKNWNLSTQKVFPVEEAELPLRTNSKGSSKDFLLKTDFADPLSEKSLFEVGAKIEARSVISDYKAEEFANNEWVIYGDINNRLNYKEIIGSAYAQFESKISKFNYLLGLRSEYTHIGIDDRNDIYNNKKDYARLFPTVNMTYSFNDATMMQLNYSRRISRPSLQLIYPFVELTNLNSQYIGNPNLNPAYTNALEWGLMQHWNKVTLNPSVYFQHTTDFILFYTYRDSKQSTFFTIPVNLDHENRYGFELSATYDPEQWLQVNGEYNVYGFQQRGNYADENFDYSSNTWNARLGTRVKFLQGFVFQARSNFIGEQRNAQSTTKSLYYVDLGLSKNLLKDKMTIAFDVTNVFDSRQYKILTRGDNYTFNRINNNNAARYRLSIVYRFNRKEEQTERKEKSGNRN
ncbi:Outer membrane receptor proteins, mostly Fe transport [Mucilaginibacter lappiensis]|uniref:Outer membrane receptor protein involved in Fe transport n=1 Tax=Mucilaginibacter lappiensis TaxID=354630 RepID=A0ABR6PW95_9SPHI|nr:TonB-dependent receptor [Mucilaginibacter lappiensis]MBB6112606.1 outer membrane receptor protein involved in Fe transport [Mucilaginibacter lappiensis]SIS05066.1 Outer membrane receptor proteins, mostly Fe transport [Mucilaginibacter lappiensis]